MNEEDKLIETEIKSRKIEYYLTTEDDLNNIKSNGLIVDLFILLFSISIGGIISIALTQATDVTLPETTLNLLQILLKVFIILSILFCFLATIFYLKTRKKINSIKGSGRVTKLNVDQTEEPVQREKPSVSPSGALHISRAYYGTTSDKSKNVTEKLRGMVVDDKLSVKVSNHIDGDPDPGTPKTLKLSYKFNDTKYKKVYKEGDQINIP